MLGKQAKIVSPALSSDARCNTPCRFDIGLVDQDLRECCNASLFTPVGRGKRPSNAHLIHPTPDHGCEKHPGDSWQQYEARFIRATRWLPLDVCRRLARRQHDLVLAAKRTNHHSPDA